MRSFLFLLCVLSLTACASKVYRAKSALEAQKFVELEVRHGMISASQRASEEARLSAGKPPEGKWDQRRMERHVAKWVKDNPRRVEINLAASNKQITESQRLLLISDLEYSEAAANEVRAARLAAVAGSLQATGAAMNAAAANMNENAARMNQSAAMYNAQPRTIYVKPTPSYYGTSPYRPSYTPPRTFRVRPSYGGSYRGTLY